MLNDPWLLRIGEVVQINPLVLHRYDVATIEIETVVGKLAVKVKMPLLLASMTNFSVH